MRLKAAILEAGARAALVFAVLELDHVMRLGWLLVLIAVPFLEIALMIKVGQMIGFWPTVLLLFISAMTGTYVIYSQGFQVMGRAFAMMSQGKPPVAPVIDGVFTLFSGLLLIMPGFISDACGLALLVPRLRHRFAIWSLRRLVKSGRMAMFGFGAGSEERGQGPNASARAPGPDDGPVRDGRMQRPPPSNGQGPVIEGEFQRLDERTVRGNRDRRDRPPSGQ